MGRACGLRSAAGAQGPWNLCTISLAFFAAYERFVHKLRFCTLSTWAFDGPHREAKSKSFISSNRS